MMDSEITRARAARDLLKKIAVLSLRSMARREAEIREEIKAADSQRGLGVMGSLSRDSVLLQNEEVFLAGTP
jgi:hypothetical protein